MTYIYLPYTAAPSSKDKNFINVKYGGYAHNYIVNKSTGYTLPNCVAFCHGMWLKTLTDARGLDYAREIESRMCRGDAEKYWDYNDGFERGQTPKLNAIMVWEGKGDRKGHVMTVTTIKANGDVIGTGSDYGGAKFYTRTYTKSSGYGINSNYIFKGFIYCPLEFAYTVGDPVERDTKKNQVKISITNLRVRSLPSLEGIVEGYANPGIYTLDPLKKNRVTADGYTWYLIGPDMWCAGVNGVEFLPKQKEDRYDVLVHNVTAEQASKIENAAKLAGATDITTTKI